MVADVTVVGTGIIALTAAIEIADRGRSVRLVGTTHSGNASSAAGGMLAPSVGRESGSAYDFAVASRDRYPAFAAALSERSGRPVPINTAGILEVALTETEAAELKDSIERPSRWLSAEELAREEPGFAPAFGAVMHPLDGSVEPLPLLDALRAVVASHDGITTAREDCCELNASELGCSVLTGMENRFASDYVVLAAGVWTPLIVGAGKAAHQVVGDRRADRIAHLEHDDGGAGAGAGGGLGAHGRGHRCHRRAEHEGAARSIQRANTAGPHR